MQLSKMKNIIVLRGMASNVVEEAIVVLKPNVKLKQSEYYSNRKYTQSDKDKKMVIVKEAENTINSYVKRLQKETKKFDDKKMKYKYKFLQISNSVLIAMLVIFAIVLL